MSADNPEESAPDAPETGRLNTGDLNRTVFISDNLPFLRSLDTESIDLVVIDPPFAKGQTFTGSLTPPLTDAERLLERRLMETWQVYDPASAYEVGIEYPDQVGTTATFQDIWDFKRLIYQDDLSRLEQTHPAAWWLIQSTRHTHSDSHAAYIAFMVERVIEIKRVIKTTGSVYLHCDHGANAYLRQMMDALFGENNFRNEIAWAYRTGGISKRYWPRKHDTILFYVKSDAYRHNPPQERVIYDKPFFSSQQDDDGEYFADVFIRDVWDDIKPLINTSKERTGYPTQKPQALARRMIEASSNPGDIVLDCFAGCAYVPVAAELTGRRWIACDMSPRSWTVVRRQFHKHPELGIGTDDGDPEDAQGLSVRLEHSGKTIYVRGPHDLPERTTDGESIAATIPSLPLPTFRQRPLENSQQIWQAFVDHWGTSCWYCGTEKAKDRRELQLDHIEPNKRDGTNDDCWNRALACVACNSDKGGNLTVTETMQKAFEAGRIATVALQAEEMTKFRARHVWATDRWNRIRSGDTNENEENCLDI